ncbi:hypothetical protein Tdes44962_MAKER02462 [Teratosphaeria destructans]|uniref:Apple domain-containing protein n=1 Tax=Teratosphaeria destructans TaxID=418781 RepID=A0A9W7STN2_9PEZI|nr:hypothetical protein Tdes44962_MAKER02462 [Teratosphaeria destructans]
MKSSSPLTTLLVAVVHSRIASGQAFSPVSTVSGTAASATTTSNALAGICPGYNGKNFTDGNSATYSVHCDAYATSENEYLVTNPSSVATAVQCMNACDEFDDCEGAVYYPGSRCVLTVGTTFGSQQNSSGVAYFIRRGAPATVSSAATISSTVTLSTLSIAKPSPKTSPAAVPTGAQVCNSSNILCPACDGETVTDDDGTSYQVYCNYKLISGSVYDVQAFTSVSGCLLRCDDYTGCLGATFWTGGNCQLVKSSPSATQEAGFTAFLPVGGASRTASPSSVLTSSSELGSKSVTSSISKASTTSVASRSGATFISDGPQSSTSHATTTGTTRTSSASASAPTNATSLSASCPASDGLNVTDVVTQNYTVSCDFEPVCETTVTGTKASYTQETCLESCDHDAVCLAATWQDGSCVLCEGSIQWLADYEAGSGKVVFLSRAVADELNQPVSALGAGIVDPATAEASSSLLPSATGQSVASAKATTSSIGSTTSSVSKPFTAPGIPVLPSPSASTLTSAISGASTGAVSVSTTLATLKSAATSLNATGSVSKPFTAPGIPILPSPSTSTLTSAISGALTGPISVSTTLATLKSAATSSNATVLVSKPFTAPGIPILPSPSTSTLTSAISGASTGPISVSTTLTSLKSATTSKSTVPASFYSSSARSSTGATGISGTYHGSTSTVPTASKPSSPSFVPPLASGIVSYATPGGETRVAGAATAAAAARRA